MRKVLVLFAPQNDYVFDKNKSTTTVKFPQNKIDYINEKVPEFSLVVVIKVENDYNGVCLDKELWKCAEEDKEYNDGILKLVLNRENGSTEIGVDKDTGNTYHYTGEGHTVDIRTTKNEIELTTMNIGCFKSTFGCQVSDKFELGKTKTIVLNLHKKYDYRLSPMMFGVFLKKRDDITIMGYGLETYIKDNYELLRSIGFKRLRLDYKGICSLEHVLEFNLSYGNIIVPHASSLNQKRRRRHSDAHEKIKTALDDLFLVQKIVEVKQKDSVYLIKNNFYISETTIKNIVANMRVGFDMMDYEFFKKNTMSERMSWIAFNGDTVPLNMSHLHALSIVHKLPFLGPNIVKMVCIIKGNRIDSFYRTSKYYYRPLAEKNVDYLRCFVPSSLNSVYSWIEIKARLLSELPKNEYRHIECYYKNGKNVKEDKELVLSDEVISVLNDLFHKNES